MIIESTSDGFDVKNIESTSRLIPLSFLTELYLIGTRIYF